MVSQKLHIGTSGWNYNHWKGPFYPADLPAKKWASYYMERFHTVEINNTFYKLPDQNTFRKWRDEAPDGFIYAVKASRYITHMKKLKDPEQPVENFLGHAGCLGDKLGPVLFQLPPRWKLNIDRLQAFLTGLPEDCQFAFEFRDDTWWDDRVYELLRRHNAAFCLFDLEGRQTPAVLTANFTYVRLHGPERAYRGKYSDSALSEWAEYFKKLINQGLAVYCYFDNDEKGYAAQNALRLKELAG
ncbi:MAG: DUF72 domain-containing protein [Desulfobacterales bacterium]